MPTLRALMIAAMAMLLVATVARAQETVRPYDKDLLRLTEILGAIHYLRAICGGDEGLLWREQMEGLLNAEGSSPLRRVKLTRSFNKGYRSYQRTYRSCTPSALTAIDRFLREGADIAATLAAVNGAAPPPVSDETADTE